MPHISKKRIDQKLWTEISIQLLNIFARARDRKNLYLLFEELFTQTERVMLSKRISIVLMLSNSIPQHRITEILSVSPTTVAKMSLNIELGKYDFILKMSKKEKLDLDKIVWVILTAGGIMPPKIGGGKYWRKYR